MFPNFHHSLFLSLVKAGIDLKKQNLDAIQFEERL
jgi:hypothetical protein